jgi:salicylate hydroxylase
MSLSVAVVGAGIGGLAASLALTRAGFEVTVFEQSAELGEVGVGLHLAPNGSRILRSWGLAEALDEAAARPQALEIRKWDDGKTLMRQPMGEAWEHEYGAPYFTLHRAALHRVLAREVPAVRLGRRLVGWSQAPGQVRLSFADGSSATADLLVGADGVHSVIRQSIAGDEEAVFSGVTAYRGLVASSASPGLADRTMFVWSGPHARLLCYPVAGGLLTYVGVVPDSEWTVESWSTLGDPAELQAAYDGWDPAVTALLTAVRETRRWALYDREPLDRWGDGRITLLGDAAHPMLPHHGQGASQALEDAVALAYCLTASPGPDGLRQYEELRRPYTAAIQLGSRGSGTVGMRPGDKAALPSMVEDISHVLRYDLAAALAGR